MCQPPLNSWNIVESGIQHYKPNRMCHSISIIYILCYVYDISGSSEFDQFLVMALTNPSLFGGLMAFLLDNTVKGSYIIVINNNINQ